MEVTTIKVFLHSLVAAGSWCRQKHTLPDLPYDYGALEPTISAEIMQLHHSKHHQTYVNNLNIGEEKLAEAKAKGNMVHNCSCYSIIEVLM